ncbi:MAG: hypothetical protein IJK36_01285 [Bacteroidales bacterium]|nr:hypothetical protein [Bacteroidales bacterium]
MYYKKTYYQSLSITIAYNAHGTLAGAASEFRKEGTFWSGFASGAVASFVSSTTAGLCVKLGASEAWTKAAMIAAGGLSGGVFNVTVAACDLSGNASQKVLDLRDLADGVYVYTVYCGKLSRTGKLVIVK